MRVSFIGMSNIGKSHWAKRLAASGNCKRIDCDGLIEKKLLPELAKGGFRGLRGMGRWMGLPDAPQHKANSALYMGCEQEVMQECLQTLRTDTDASVVVDTTGSVIYTDAATQAALRAQTKIIYFEASEAHVATMFRAYIANPKPTIWGDLYAPVAGEEPRDTLKRCYPLLLQERARRYRALAHLVLPYAQHKAPDLDLQALIDDDGLTP